MPVITEEGVPERRKRSGRGLWLLLVPPVLALILLVAAGIQPLQLGPYVLVVAAEHHPGFGWKPMYFPVPNTSPGAHSTSVNGRDCVIIGEGQLFALGLGDWAAGVLWFRGYLKRSSLV